MEWCTISIIGLVVAVVFYLFWVGLFKSMHIVKAKFSATYAFYKPYKGTYDQALAPIFEEVYQDIQTNILAYKAYSRNGSKTFGIFYDDPKLFPGCKQLRAEVGFLCSMNQLLNSEKERLLKEMKDKGFSHTTFKDTE